METEIKIGFNDNVESAVYLLLAAKARGEKAFIDFDGHILHSDTVSMDSAFKEILGYTKAEYDQKVKELEIEQERRIEAKKQRAESMITQWIEKGKHLIYPEKYEDWERCVVLEANDSLYYGTTLDYSLEIMQALEDGKPLEEVINIYNNQGHSGGSAGTTQRIVFSFSKKGPEFIETLLNDELSPELKEKIEKQKQENKTLEQLHLNQNDGSKRHM